MESKATRFGAEALTGIESTPPEAVTLDISLPDGSGIEVLKHISRHV